MFRRLTRAIVEAILQIVAALLAGAGRAFPRSAERQCHFPAQADPFGQIRIASEEPRPPRPGRMKSPDPPIMEVGWAG
jgi:hypothetical protein